jgi:hypothetical protein
MEDIVQEYECSICACVAYPPVTTDCSHIFCENCIKQWVTEQNTCPNCQKMNPKTERHAFTERILNNRKVKCPNNCGFKGNLIEFLQQHKSVCPLEVISCDNDGCDIRVQRQFLSSHKKECKYRIIQCDYCEHDIVFLKKR